MDGRLAIIYTVDVAGGRLQSLAGESLATEPGRGSLIKTATSGKVRRRGLTVKMHIVEPPVFTDLPDAQKGRKYGLSNKPMYKKELYRW